MRPIFDREAFADDVSDWLEEQGLSYRDARSRYPLLNPALLSRAVHGRILSVESMLAVCEAAKLDPLAYTCLRSERNQPVTAIVKRETTRIHDGGRA